MEENGRVHPDCVNAANPYHECGAFCVEKIDGKGRKDKEKKKFENRNGITEVVLNKRNDDRGRLQSNCPKADNPYHECNEFCNQRTSKAYTIGVRKESGDLNKNIKVGNGRVHQTCAKASNPYHECDENCFQGTKETKTQGLKRESDIRNGIKQGDVSKKTDVERKVYPSCPKASNPYHECDENCFKRSSDADTRFRNESGSKFLEASRSFGRKKKGSETSSPSPRGAVYNDDLKSPRSHFSMKKMEVEDEYFSSSEKHAEEIYSQDQSFDKARVQHSQSLPMSGKITSPADAPTKVKDAERALNSPKVISDANTLKASLDVNAEDGREDANSSNFSFSEIVREVEESDKEEVESIISDSCVSIGKYHVKASISSTLQSIFDKYGDIAANCQLESASMRAYYLECLCAVIQELNSIPFKQLNKSKLKEMFAVLKDVETVKFDVRWLRALLNELSEAVEFVSQRQTFEAKKGNSDRLLASAKTELEAQMEALSQKEKEAADAREQVAETEARMEAIEQECSQLEDTISSIVSTMEKFQGKPLAAKLF